MAGADLTTALLRRVSRSFYLSLTVLPPAVRPTIGLAYLLARASDTIADTRLIDRTSRITHLETLRAALGEGDAAHVSGVVRATSASQALPAERALL
ncbi:MAG TPA: squalene/phytoene synthase family protein, partial [Verrucomicrobiae bacterium]|nr:squalene/phytoene synthase family protein [Verrucomicrobiae bacterium]